MITDKYFPVYDEPSPIWLQKRLTIKHLHEKAIREDWYVSKLVEEMLRLGVATEINYVNL